MIDDGIRHIDRGLMPVALRLYKAGKPEDSGILRLLRQDLSNADGYSFLSYIFSVILENHIPWPQSGPTDAAL